MLHYSAPQQSAFEAWQPKQGFHTNRNQRRYSSSNVHSMRSNPGEFWPQQQNAAVPRTWHDQSSYPDSPASTSSSLRPGADPWLPTSQYVLSSSQSPTPCTSYGDTTAYTSAGFGSHWLTRDRHVANMLCWWNGNTARKFFQKESWKVV